MLKNLDFNYTKEENVKIAELRALIEADDNLSIGTEDTLLSKFLYYTNWQVPEAFQGIQSYYEFKLRHPDWIAQRPLEKYRELFFDINAKFIMPKPDRDGRGIIVFKTVDAFDRYPDYLQSSIQLDDIMFESMFLTPQVQKNGITIIYDLTEVTANVIKILSPSTARILDKKNSVLPFTSRRIHYIQKGVIMNTVLTLFKNCLNKKVREVIFNHDVKNMKKLQEMIGYESTPAEYGGPAENKLDSNFTFNHLIEHEAYLQKIQNYHKKVSTK